MERNKKERDLMDGGEKWAKFDCDAKSTSEGAATVLHLSIFTSETRQTKGFDGYTYHMVWYGTIPYFCSPNTTRSHVLKVTKGTGWWGDSFVALQTWTREGCTKSLPCFIRASHADGGQLWQCMCFVSKCKLFLG